MARMYSRKKGKARSVRPRVTSPPSWSKYKPEEIELLITKLAKQDNTTAALIGIILRDSYGIPDIKIITKKSITQIMKEKKLLPELPEDLMALIKKDILVKKHLEENKKDMTAKRGLELTDSKIRRLITYYKKTGKIAKDWKYNADSLRLLIE